MKRKLAAEEDKSIAQRLEFARALAAKLKAKWIRECDTAFITAVCVCDVETEYFGSDGDYENSDEDGEYEAYMQRLNDELHAKHSSSDDDEEGKKSQEEEEKKQPKLEVYSAPAMAILNVPEFNELVEKLEQSYSHFGKGVAFIYNENFHFFYRKHPIVISRCDIDDTMHAVFRDEKQAPDAASQAFLEYVSFTANLECKRDNGATKVADLWRRRIKTALLQDRITTPLFYTACAVLIRRKEEWVEQLWHIVLTEKKAFTPARCKRIFRTVFPPRDFEKEAEYI